MNDYSMYRAVRFDHADGLLDKLKLFMATAVMQCILYDEEGATTMKPHYQGWIKFESEEQAAAWDERWKTFKSSIWPSRKGAGRGGNRPTYVKSFKNGEAAQVYCAKDGKLVYNQNVDIQEVARLAKKSYQKGATRKQTFLNAIVQRMKEKNVKSKADVYHELIKYYDENDKELNPWRLQSQTNTVCYKLWGEKFSQWLAQTEVRVNYYAPQEDVPPPASSSEEVSEESECSFAEECPPEHNVLQADDNAVTASSTASDDMDGVPPDVPSGSASSVHGVHVAVRQLQDSRDQVVVHSPVGFSGRGQRHTGPVSDTSPRVHGGRSQRVPVRVISKRVPVSRVRKDSNDS